MSLCLALARLLVVVAGAKFAAPHWWTTGLDTVVRQVNRPCVTSFEGFERPWALLDELLPGLQVQVDPFDVTYVAWARMPERVRPAITQAAPSPAPRAA